MLVGLSVRNHVGMVLLLILLLRPLTYVVLLMSFCQVSNGSGRRKWTRRSKERG
jgi:hypothetical protein